MPNAPGTPPSPSEPAAALPSLAASPLELSAEDALRAELGARLRRLDVDDVVAIVDAVERGRRPGLWGAGAIFAGALVLQAVGVGGPPPFVVVAVGLAAAAGSLVLASRSLMARVADDHRLLADDVRRVWQLHRGIARRRAAADLDVDRAEAMRRCAVDLVGVLRG